MLRLKGKRSMQPLLECGGTKLSSLKQVKTKLNNNLRKGLGNEATFFKLK